MSDEQPLFPGFLRSVSLPSVSVRDQSVLISRTQNNEKGGKVITKASQNNQSEEDIPLRDVTVM